MAQHGQKPLKAHQVPPGGSRSSYSQCDGECHHLSISSAVTEERPVCQCSVFQVEDLQNLRVCILATARALRKQFNCLSFRLKDLPQTCTVHRAITVLHQEGRGDPEPRPFPAQTGWAAAQPMPTAPALLQEGKHGKGFFLQRNPEASSAGLIGAKARFPAFQERIESSHNKNPEWNRHTLTFMTWCSASSPCFVQPWDLSLISQFPSSMNCSYFAQKSRYCSIAVLHSQPWKQVRQHQTLQGGHSQLSTGLRKVATLLYSTLASWMHYAGETECNKAKLKQKKKFCQDSYQSQRGPVLDETCDIRHSTCMDSVYSFVL